MIGNVLEIIAQNEEERLDSQEYVTLFDQNRELTELTLMGVSLDRASITSLRNCLDANPLQTVNLSCTLLSAQAWNTLLHSLSTHPTLTALFLSDCVIDDNAKEALIALLAMSKTLEYINISGHHLTIDEKLMSAIKQSTKLVKIDGVQGLTNATLEHLEQNKRYQQLEKYLQAWSVEDLHSKTMLNIRKQIFYKIVHTIQATNHQKNRLNNLLAQFYSQLADFYLQNNDKELVEKYGKRILELDTNDKSLFYKAHEMLGNLFYNEASLRINHPEDANDFNCGKKYLLTAYQHLGSAVQSATQENKPYIQKLEARCGIILGETILQESDDYLENSDSFSRKYISKK